MALGKSTFSSIHNQYSEESRTWDSITEFNATNLSENWLFQFFNQDSYLTFDGTDDFVDCGAVDANSAISLGSSTGATVAFWVKFTTAGAFEWIFHNDVVSDNDYAGLFVYKDDGEKINFAWGNNTGGGSSNRESMVGNQSIALNTWYFVAIATDFALTESSGVVTGTSIYTASESAGSVTTNAVTNAGTANVSTPTYTSGRAYFGRRGDTESTHFGEFQIKRFGIWNEKLTSTEVTALYNSGNYLSFVEDSGNYESSANLVSYCEFNNGDPIVRDLQGNFSGLVQGANYGGFLPLALNNTTCESVFYNGAITSQNPTLRESIDLTTSKAASNNLSIDIANYQYQGDSLSAEILLGSNTYLNRGVRIFSQINDDTDLDNCIQIFHGRLTDINHNIENVNVTLSSIRPWDKISFPQNKHTKYNVYEPVVYGDYNFSDATSGTSDAVFGGVFPVPILYTNRNTITTIMPKSYASSSNAYLHHYVGYDWFCSIKDEASNAISEQTITESNVNILETPTSHRSIGYIRTNNAGFDASDTGGTVTYLTNPQNALQYDESTGASDTSTFATGDIDSTSDIRYLVVQTPNNEFSITLITAVKISQSVSLDDGSGDPQQYQIDFFGNEYDSSADDLLSSPTTDEFTSAISTNTYTFDASPANVVASENALVCPDELLIKFDPQHNAPLYDHEDHELRVHDVQLRFENRFNFNDDDAKRLADKKYFYCGADGLTASWDGDAITHGHDAHRDLLIRFAGLDNNDPDGWSALNVDRAKDNWKIRYWQLEPTSLKEVLEKLQYEFGFIAKYSPSGKLKYIYPLQKSEFSADHNLTMNDVKNLQIKNTSLSEVITQMNISNHLHPAETRKYYSITTSKNTNTRAKYNFSAKENIKDINLDMNIGTIPTTPNTDINRDFFSYYNGILGDVKKIVSCEVVNPAKGFKMETGDIVSYSDMGVDPGGESWSNQYFMIINLQRSPGKVSIVTREVG